jgi:hypothetical protein
MYLATGEMNERWHLRGLLAPSHPPLTPTADSSVRATRTAARTSGLKLPKLQFDTKSPKPLISSRRSPSHTRDTPTAHNASQAAHPCLHRPPDHHNLDTRANPQIRRQWYRARHSPGHIRQICHQDTAAREAARHIHGVFGGCGRAAILLCRACWQLCTYTQHYACSFASQN